MPGSGARPALVPAARRIVQELLPLQGYDLRLVVAKGRVVGAAERVALPASGGQTSHSGLGCGRRGRPRARTLGVAAVAAIGADFVGVDLAPTDSGYVVLELNGAVDFDDRYSLAGMDVYAEAALALGLTFPARQDLLAV